MSRVKLTKSDSKNLKDYVSVSKRKITLDIGVFATAYLGTLRRVVEFRKKKSFFFLLKNCNVFAIFCVAHQMNAARCTKNGKISTVTNICYELYHH